MGVDIFCPPLKGEGDQPNGWWKGPTPDVRPPTRKRVLSPFQGGHWAHSLQHTLHLRQLFRFRQVQ